MDFLKYMDRIEDKIGQKFEGTDKNLLIESLRSLGLM